jgi:hypothetical protein
MLTDQGDVNGSNTQPIWKYLKENSTPPVKDIDWVCTISLPSSITPLTLVSLFRRLGVEHVVKGGHREIADS